VFSGSSYEPLETAVPQQFFATSMYLTPLVRGALGIEPDAPRGVLALAPHLFTTPGTLTVTGVRLGGSTFEVRYDQRDTLFAMTVRRTAGATSVTLRVSPALAPGARLREVTVDGRRVAARTEDHGRDVHVSLEVPMAQALRTMEIVVRHAPGWRIETGDAAPERGSRSRNLKVLDARAEGGGLLLEVEGVAGRSYEVVVHGPVGPPRREVLAMPAVGGDPRDGYVRISRRLRR
jgi:hypothetical protein